MAQCLNCQNEVGEDFGLVTCSNCGASLFIDMDGQAVSGDDASDSPPENIAQATVINAQAPVIPEAPFEEEDGFVIEELGASEEYSQSNVSLDLSELPAAESDGNLESYEEPADLEQDWQEAVATEESVEDEAHMEDHGGADENEAFEPDPEEGEVVEEEVQTPVYEAPPASSDFQDVMDFANSDASQAREGTLKYRLLLTGIDTLDLRNAIKEALTDKRFIWDIEAMVRGIQNGVLEIDQVPAVKAFVLITRLAHLPIQIKWVQQPMNQP